MVGDVLAAFFFGLLTMAPCFPDPYHGKESLVSFWEWLFKELNELLNGEHEGYVEPW